MPGTKLIILFLTLVVIIVMISMIINLSAFEKNQQIKAKGESRLE